jgi:isoquinoline 1-oxidoreductase beta subunit
MNSVDANLGRRHFLIGTAVIGTSLGISLYLGGRLGRPTPAEVASKASLAPNAFLRVGADDSITVILGKSEMGQGVWSSLPMVVAEELDVDPAVVKVEFAPPDPAFFSPPFPTQITGGSSSMRTMYEPLRRTGATARAMLIAAAAQRWGTDPGQLTTANGVVTDGTHRARYGELAEAAAKLAPPENVALKDPKHFRYLGKTTVRRLDAPAKVNGSAQFGLDVRLPGMLFAMVARSPVFGGTVASFDDKAARAIPGVVAVKQVPSGVAVIATNTFAARRGRDALQVQWNEGNGASFSTATLREEYSRLARTPGALATKVGDADQVLIRTKRIIEAEYVLPYLAHACMEPLNCTVHISGDQRDISGNKCDIWTGTQWQTQDMNRAAAALGFEPSQVHIHTTFLGGGFGRRANPVSDIVVEAVHVAKGIDKPVQTVWTREDDMRGGYYRPFFLHRVRGALDTQGMPLAWRHTIVGQSIFAGVDLVKDFIRDGIDPASVEGVTDLPYAVPNLMVDLHSPVNVVPTQWWRSVGHTHTAFAVNCFLDELAAAARKDPVELRRALLASKPRHRAVLDLAAEKAGWGKPLPQGHFHGVALEESFGSIVAQVAEVSVTGSDVRVHRVVCVIDCGFAVIPDQVAAQMESGIVYGLSAALRGEITLDAGRVQQSNFHDYTPLRLNEMPVVETHIVASGAPMGGAGEPGTPCIAPAVCNAIFAATGKRIRELPISRSLQEIDRHLG